MNHKPMSCFDKKRKSVLFQYVVVNKIILHHVFQKCCLLSISMETTTNTKNSITRLDRASFQQQNTLFLRNYNCSEFGSYWVQYTCSFVLYKNQLSKY